MWENRKKRKINGARKNVSIKKASIGSRESSSYGNNFVTSDISERIDKV